MMNKTFDREKTAAIIRNLCEERGMTVDMISEEMNVSVQTIYAWYSGRKVPTLDHLVELSDILRVALDDIVVRKPVKGG